MKTKSKKFILTVMMTGAVLMSVRGQIMEVERPAEWKNLVSGARFMDLFLPMPVRDSFGKAPWGGENVNPRDVGNGIEDTEWTYWCADPFLDENGVYHLFSTRWREDHPQGHFGYFDSEIIRATSQDPMGPYIYRQTLGEGHNSDILVSKKGNYIVYSANGRYFFSRELEGPWERRTFDFHKRERYVFPNYVNFSFVQRTDGSYLALSRRGWMWVSPDGEENWYNVSAATVFHKFSGTFEDPVIWKDDIQYHCIVNDWKGRIAYYYRSIDGFHWKLEPGEAYAPGIARYENGKVSDWFKYERIRFVHDALQRPTHALFAVIDILKHDDLMSDNHNGKTIVIPMVAARQLELLDTKPITQATKTIRVRVKAEAGFDPHTDMDLESLRFGAADEVNYGRGCKVMQTRKDGADLIVTFDAAGHGVTKDNWACKLLGRRRDGQVLFGWVRLPDAVSEVPLLSPLSPKFEFTDTGLEAYVEIQNFGTVSSKSSGVRVLAGDQELACGTVRPLRPFEKSIVRLVCGPELPAGSRQEITVRVESEGLPAESFTRNVTLPRNGLEITE